MTNVYEFPELFIERAEDLIYLFKSFFIQQSELDFMKFCNVSNFHQLSGVVRFTIELQKLFFIPFAKLEWMLRTVVQIDGAELSLNQLWKFMEPELEKTAKLQKYHTYFANVLLLEKCSKRTDLFVNILKTSKTQKLRMIAVISFSWNLATMDINVQEKYAKLMKEASSLRSAQGENATKQFKKIFAKFLEFRMKSNFPVDKSLTEDDKMKLGLMINFVAELYKIDAISDESFGLWFEPNMINNLNLEDAARLSFIIGEKICKSGSIESRQNLISLEEKITTNMEEFITTALKRII